MTQIGFEPLASWEFGIHIEGKQKKRETEIQ